MHPQVLVACSPLPILRTSKPSVDGGNGFVQEKEICPSYGRKNKKFFAYGILECTQFSEKPVSIACNQD